MPDFSLFLSASSYERAHYLLNIPDLVYLEEKVGVILSPSIDNNLQQSYQGMSRHHPVLENVEKTKKCNIMQPSLLQVHTQDTVDIAKLSSSCSSSQI